ncbi:MAG: M24 family metallopeptidase [Acidimicrobiia bacterium]
MNHAQRLSALTERLSAPLLVSKAPNLHYLTGFTGSSGWLLARPDGRSTFVTDGRYGELAEELVTDLPGAELVVYTSGLWDVFRSLVDGEVTLEADGVTWEFATDFGRETEVDVVAGGGAVEELRRTKDEDEVDALQAAATAGDRAFSALASISEPSLSEEELGWRLIDEMRKAGGQAAGWEPIVAAGAGASIPHYRSGRSPVGTGLLLMDYGCTVEGYHSDMTRTVWLTGTPDEEMGRVYRAVAESQEAGLAAVAPGVTCGAVDEAVREVLRGYGYEKEFLHSTGHGVGLEIHEPPWVRRGNDDELQPGDAITIEPGVYLPGIGGVRIEDMVLVTETGSQVFTNSSKEPTAP